MGHVGDDHQHGDGSTHHLQQTHHVGVVSKLGQELGLTQKAFLRLLIRIIYSKNEDFVIQFQAFAATR